jgi:hypothetical protein
VPGQATQVVVSELGAHQHADPAHP